MYVGLKFAEDVKHYFTQLKYFDALDKKTQERIMRAYFDCLDTAFKDDLLTNLAVTPIYQQMISTILGGGFTHSTFSHVISNYILERIRPFAEEEFNRLINEWNADYYAQWYI